MVSITIPIPAGLTGFAIGIMLITLTVKFVFVGVFRLVFLR